MRADNEANANDVVVYIMPQRIQKKMLQDIKNGISRTTLHLREKYGYLSTVFFFPPRVGDHFRIL